MPAVVTLMLVILTLPLSGRPAARAGRLQGCNQVCQDSLVPCGRISSQPGPVVSTKRRVHQAQPSCSRVQGLTRRQRVFCRRHSDLLPALLEGVRRGTKECRRRFRNHRWNCHALSETASGQRLEFGHVLVKGTPETAVWYALHSAAITHALYKACRRGELRSCSCGAGGRRAHALERWKWTGCQRGLKFSAKKSRRFVNSREVEQDARSKMNVHNNKVGIRLVSRHWRRPTKCQVFSGICVSSARWQEVPRSFSAIGALLAAERERSVLVAAGADGGLREVGTGARPSRRRLVHLEPSPQYCDPDLETGFQGTADRPCRKNKSAAGSCEELCCGRGNSTRIVRQVFCCNFHTNSASPSRCRQQTRVRQCN